MLCCLSYTSSTKHAGLPTLKLQDGSFNPFLEASYFIWIYMRQMMPRSRILFDTQWKHRRILSCSKQHNCLYPTGQGRSAFATTSSSRQDTILEPESKWEGTCPWGYICTRLWQKRYLVWERSERSHLCQSGTSIMKHRWQPTTTSICHIQCSFCDASTGVLTSIHILTKVTLTTQAMCQWLMWVSPWYQQLYKTSKQMGNHQCFSLKEAIS